MGRDREEDRRQGARQGARRRRRAVPDRRAAGDARLGARADADPRLSHPRPLPRQSRSARPRAAQGRRGARSALLRLQRGRLRPQDLPRQGARARIRHPARDRRDLSAHLLPDARRRVHAHLERRPEGLDPGAHRRRRQGDHLHARGQARDPQQAGRGRRLREILRHQVHRHQALRPRRRRVADPGARADHQARRQSRREGDRARHAASRAAQRAHAGDGQAAPRAVPRVQGRLGRARRRRRLGRREVSPRRLVGPRVRRQQGASLAHREPLASRDRQPGGARQGARQAGPARRDAGRPHHGDAAADARRRGVRRPGRGRRMLRALGAEGLPHRRLDPFHRQQPDRLHHLSALLALLALSVRRRQDDRGADLPRERRRSGSRGLCREGRDRVPAEIPEAGRHRHVLLSPLRPQRRRRAGLHPAADVQGDPRASLDHGDLFQEADRRRRRHRGRSREDEGRLALAPRGRIRGRHRLQAEQGRLARRPLVEVQVLRRHRRSAPRQYRRRDRDAEGHRQEDHHGAGRLPRPPHHPALPRQPPQGDRDRRGHRLGDRRGARLLLAAARRPPRAPLGPGLASAARSRSAIRC